MTPTTGTWIALLGAAAITAVTTLRSRPPRVPVRNERAEVHEDWRPHVTSGCGR
jgi:hypothetical protein